MRDKVNLYSKYFTMLNVTRLAGNVDQMACLQWNLWRLFRELATKCFLVFTANVYIRVLVVDL